MRIDDRNAVSGGAANRTDELRGAEAVTGGKHSSQYQSRIGGDSVELSGSSLLVRNSDNARAARIAQLAKSVQSGSYSVSPALVSKSLVSETLANQVEHGSA